MEQGFLPRQGYVCVRRMIAGLALAGFVLLSGAHAQAQGQGQGKKGDGDDLKLRVDRILEKHDVLLGTVKSKFEARCQSNDRNCDVMRKTLDRAEKAQVRAKSQQRRMRGEDYGGLRSIKRAKCNGKCSETNEVAIEEPNTQDEEAFGAEMADELAEIEDGLDQTNALLADDAQAQAFRSFAAFSATSSTAGFQSLYDYLDDPDYPKWLHIADNPKAIIPSAFAITIAAKVAAGIHGVATNFCQQDILGFNGSAVCSITAVIAVALDGTATLLNFNMSDATAWDAKGAYMRAADLNHNLGVVNAGVSTVAVTVGDTATAVAVLQSHVTELQKSLSALKQQMEQQSAAARAVQSHLIQMLLLPEGRRTVPATILTCTGAPDDLCPVAPVSCSDSTGLCGFNK